MQRLIEIETRESTVRRAELQEASGLEECRVGEEVRWAGMLA